MKYIAKISSILLTVAVVVAIVYATDKNNETRLSKSSNTQQIQEKNLSGSVNMKRESVEVHYDKEEVLDGEQVKPTETEKDLPVGDGQIIPINDVVHSAQLNNAKQKSSVYTNSTQMTEPVEELSKEEIQELIQAFQADPMSITKSEHELIESHVNLDFQNDASVDRGANFSSPSVVINELMYNPAMPLAADGSSNTNDDREFVEFHNTTGAAIDMSGWYFSQGVVDTFPSGTSIAAHGYLVSARDSAAYYAKYGVYPDVCCWDSGALGNSGEDVVLRNASGVTIDSVDYEDGSSTTETTNGWLGSTDGTGPSLERIHPNLNGAASTNLAWAAYSGTDSAGTPGARNSTYQDLLVEGFESGASGWQILSNPNGQNSSSNVAGILTSSTYSHSGAKTFRFSSYYSASSSGGDYTQYLISPELSVQSGDSLAFWYRSYYGSESFQVGVSTTDSLPASFTFGSSNTASSTQTRFSLDLSDNAGQNVFVAIKYTSSYAYYMYIDDITGPAIVYPSTPAGSLSASSLALGDVLIGSSNTATVSLSNNGTSDLVYTVASDNAAFTVSSASGTVAWLESQELTVTYTPTAETADTGNLIFTHNGASSPDTVSLTGSGTYSILVEGFENGAWAGSPGAPTGWSQLAVVSATSSTAKWHRNGPYTPGSTVYAGNYSAKASYTFSGHEHVLISPALNLSANANATLGYQLEFMIKGYSYSGLDVYVEIDTASTTAGGSPDFTGTDTLFTFIGGTGAWASAWTAQEARLTSYSGTYHIGFRVDDANGYYAYLDDIEVLPVPPQPTVELDANSFKMTPQLVGESVVTQLTVGANSGGGALVVSSVTSSNADFAVALTTMATGDTVVAGGDLDLDVTWAPSAFGMKNSTVIITHNAASSPDTLTLMGEAGRQYVDFNDQDFPYGWRNLDLDPEGTYETEYYGYAEGEGWSHYTSYGPGYGGAYARSHFSVDGSNDWMITEKVMPVAGDSMVFYSNSSSSSILEDSLFVYVSESSNEVDSLLVGTHLDTVISQGYTNIRSAYSLANWVGDTVFLAIQHRGSAGTNYYSYRKVDDMLLPQNWVNPNAVLAGLPGEVSFDAVFPGETSTETGSMFNAGASNLVISSVVVDNAAFSVTPTSATLLPDSSLAYTATFVPTASGPDTAHVVITSNAASSPDTVLFTGSGLPTSGGPDADGNTWVSSRNANGTPFAWIDTSGAYDTGAMTSDDSYGVIDLPFSIRLYGLYYNSIAASSNGLITLGDFVGGTAYSNYPIPTSSTPNLFIAPMWDDWTLSTWSTGIPGAILTKTVGYPPNRKFAVTFQDMVKYGSNTDYYTWQVVFDEATENIVIQYLDLSGSTASANYGAGATVGIENADGTDGLEVSYNGSYTLEDSTTITFVPGALPATGIEGVVVSTDDSQVGGVEVWMDGSMLTETGQNTVFGNPGFEDSSFVGGWNNNATEPWWVYPPELLAAPNFYHSTLGDLIWNDSLGALGSNVFYPASGSRALKVWGQYTAGTANYTTIYKEVAAPAEGTDAYASAWAMTAEDNKLSGGNGFFVSLIWLNASYAIIHQDQSERFDAEWDTDEWHHLEVHGAAPAGAAVLQMTLSFYQDADGSTGSVYVDETRASLTPGHYAYYGAPPGEHSVTFAKDGFNSSHYETTLALNDTVELNGMITPETLVDYHSGFEADDDLGSSQAEDVDGDLFAVLDSLHIVLYDSVGLDSTGATVYDTVEYEVDPALGDGMLVYPGSGRDLYGDDAVALWIAGETFDASNYLEGGGYLNMSWWANFETEEDYDYFYVGLMLEDSSIIWDEENGALSGASSGWDYFATDVSWVNSLAGAESVTPVVMFESDGSATDGWGGAFDELSVDGNPYFLAGPGHLEAGSFGSTVPVHWEEPATAGRAIYNLRRFNLRDMDNLNRPMVNHNGTFHMLSKGQREYESLQIEVDYDNASLPRDIVSYTLSRREWSDGMIGEWEELSDALTTNDYEDSDVEDGNYYDYQVTVMYDQGPGDWESNEAQAHVGIPVVHLVDSLMMEDFYPDLGGWTVHTTDSTVSWVVGDSAHYDSLNTVYYTPPGFDSSFAFVVGAGQNGLEGTIVLMSPFMDWGAYASGVVSADVWHYTPSNWYDFYGNARLMVRAQMEEWHELVDLSYSHSTFDPEVVDAGPMVGGRDRVQFALVYDYSNYATGQYNGLAVDNFELHIIDGPHNLTYTNDTESVTLHWEGFDGRRSNEYPDMMSQEEKEAQIQLLQNGIGKNIAGAQTLGRSLDGSGDIRNNSRDAGDDMSEPYMFTLDGDTMLTGTTVGFTNDYDEICPYSGSTAPDVVYLMTVPDSVNGIIITLCDAEYDSKVYVYSAADLQAGDTTDIACNDDYCSNEFTSYASYLELGSMMAEDGGVSAGDYYIVVDGYGSAEGTYHMEVSEMIPPPALMYNVWKDGVLTADEMHDTVLTYTDYNVSLLEAEYTVNASRLMEMSIEGNSGLEVGYVHSEHTNAVHAAKENQAPGAFNLVTPADGASLVITDDNIGGNQIFAWSQSVDPNGSEITYHILWETATDTGMFQIWDDTTGTAFLVPVANIAGIMTALAEATGEYIADFSWTVWADDGWDEVEASNGPRTITVDVGWYLGIDDVAAVPGVFALHQNYPNPFNPVTTIRYDVPEQAHVTMEIYNLLGQKVATLVNGIQEPGYHAIMWNGTNMSGAAMSSGMYFYHIQAGDFRSVKKLILVK